MSPRLTSSPSLLCVLQGQPKWSPWTPWSECSASCGPARRQRHHFCPSTPSVAPLSAAPTPLCPGPEAEEELCLLPACDRECPSPVDQHMPWRCCKLAPGPTKPFNMPSLVVIQEKGVGGLGDPGPAAVGAVEEACTAGPEPVTSRHLRAWDFSARGLRRRGKPARLSHAQVPSRDVVGPGAEEKVGEQHWAQPIWCPSQ